MLNLRKAEARGTTRLDWLTSRHTFSFGSYVDPRFAGFRDLLVINEDRVAPGAGFPTHAHRDMEILSYVIAGALAHRDSLGTSSVIRPGELQRMSAGTGIRHSEFNASATEPVHFLQIWIRPQTEGLAPGYQQLPLREPDGSSRLDVIASRDGRAGSLIIHSDVAVYRATLRAGDERRLALAADRAAWAHAVAGDALVNELPVSAGDGLAITGEDAVRMTATTGAEILVFDLA
jgi:hypothetical protein